MLAEFGVTDIDTALLMTWRSAVSARSAPPVPVSAMIFVVPTASAVAKPLVLIDATVGSSDRQVIGSPMSAPRALKMSA